MTASLKHLALAAAASLGRTASLQRLERHLREHFDVRCPGSGPLSLQELWAVPVYVFVI